MHRINQAQAKTIIDTALSRGGALGLKPLSVAVLDPGGHLVAFEREDCASLMRAQIAIGKAAGALALGMSSRKIGDMAAERPSFLHRLARSLRLALFRQQAGW